MNIKIKSKEFILKWLLDNGYSRGDFYDGYVIDDEKLLSFADEMFEICDHILSLMYIDHRGVAKTDKFCYLPDWYDQVIPYEIHLDSVTTFCPHKNDHTEIGSLTCLECPHHVDIVDGGIVCSNKEDVKLVKKKVRDSIDTLHEKIASQAKKLINLTSENEELKEKLSKCNNAEPMKPSDFKEITMKHVVVANEMIKKDGSCCGIKCDDCPFNNHNTGTHCDGKYASTTIGIKSDIKLMTSCKDFIVMVDDILRQAI